MKDVFVTGIGSHLPGPPVPNEDIARRLGITDRAALRIGRAALRRNGIRTRHYALDADGNPTATAASLSAEAGRAALAAARRDPAEVDFLAAASSQNDMMAPGIASAVHGEIGGRPAEIASFTSFCASGVMAMRGGVSAVAGGHARTALVCAGEFASRFLREGYLAGAAPDASTQMLRWTLSDGAGAVVLEPRPAERGPSLRVDWIDLVSNAHRMPPCMTGGGRMGADGQWQPWSSYPTLHEAVADGAFHLRQDLATLDRIVPLGIARYAELVEAGRIDPEAVDWALYHFSSRVFRDRMLQLAREAGLPVNENRIFTNLPEKGNTGSASIFVMLDELVASGRARPGQRVLCMVPESGRFITAFMMLTVVGPETSAATGRLAVESAAEGAPPPDMPQAEGDSVRARLLRGLARVWGDFEADLHTVPVVRRITAGGLRLDDYRALLVNLRQQVVDGARWIARAVSNISGDDPALRGLFLRHAAEEHRDYTLLEQDYLACGGTLETIRGAEKNIGSEALSAWMFHRASQLDPLDLLGAMFVIEGLGSRVAGRWADRIAEQLGLEDGQLRFLRHHAHADDGHMDRLWSVLDEDFLTAARADAILKTARVTARLYRLQLEEIGRA